MWGQNRDVMRRTAERRQLEDEAPRLAATVPGLEKLRLEVVERSSTISRPEHSHVRHVVVANAPALFILPCHDTHCKDGGHDVTHEILAALRRRNERFEGEDLCSGMVGNGGCSRILRYVAVATYQT
jgi:hypothetical protein